MEPERTLNARFRRRSARRLQHRAVIEMHGITKTYSTAAGTFVALEGIDLRIDRGELVAIVGKSGSGKSTLLNLAGGIDRPSRGSITIAGTLLGAMSENRLASWRGRTAGLVFQFFQLLPTLTAAENVMLPMDFAGAIPPRQRRPRAIALLERVGVARQSDKLPTALSGGEQQRVAIARALANDPPVVLADEPTGNLDSATALAVIELFRDMADRGTTVVIATHDRDLARVADRTIELADGMLVPPLANGEARPRDGRATRGDDGEARPRDGGGTREDDGEEARPRDGRATRGDDERARPRDGRATRGDR